MNYRHGFHAGNHADVLKHLVLVALLTDSLYVLAASVAASRIGSAGRSKRFGRYATAATFIGLGLFTAASGSRSAGVSK